MKVIKEDKYHFYNIIGQLDWIICIPGPINLEALEMNDSFEVSVEHFTDNTPPPLHRKISGDGHYLNSKNFQNKCVCTKAPYLLFCKLLL